MVGEWLSVTYSPYQPAALVVDTDEQGHETLTRSRWSSVTRPASGSTPT
jgi:hypothetical protein